MVKQKRTINKVDRCIYIYIYMIKLKINDIIIPIVNKSKEPTLCSL